MLARLSASGSFALLVTVSLFWCMQALVNVHWNPQPIGKPFSVDMVRVVKQPPPPEKPDPVRPPMPEPPPQTLRPTTTTELDVTAFAVSPPEPIDVGDEATLFGTADRGATPRFRVEPDYPISAAQRGIEGWATLRFTVNEIGSVEEAVVVASEPGSVFDRASLRAVRRWKYDPKVVNGRPEIQPGMQVTLEFTLDR